MPITFTEDSFLQTNAQTRAFGHNAHGKTETGTLETQLMFQYPTAFASYRRQVKAGKYKAGDIWLWQEGTTPLIFLIVRESAVGATRLRYVQQIVMTLARDYRLLGIRELALAPLGDAYERPEIEQLLTGWFAPSALSVLAYRR